MYRIKVSNKLIHFIMILKQHSRVVSHIPKRFSIYQVPIVSEYEPVVEI